MHSLTFWLFKISGAGRYPDIFGEQYVYDNTHSVRVAGGDEFLYLNKTTTTYGLTGAGRVRRITTRRPVQSERHSARVERVFTAHITDFTVFKTPLDLCRQTANGRRNREQLELPPDVNAIGWSISMPQISQELFVRLLDAALGSQDNLGHTVEQEPEWHIDDCLALVKVRQRIAAFRRIVLERHSHRCAVCGTRLLAALEVAHVRGYAADPANRANPANGICLCCFCHAAFDAGQILVMPDGTVKVLGNEEDLDEVSKGHFLSIPQEIRREWLAGVNPDFLLERGRRWSEQIVFDEGGRKGTQPDDCPCPAAEAVLSRGR